MSAYSEWYYQEKRRADAAEARAKALIEALRDARDNGLIYWEPNTERGHVSKALMLARIDAALASSDAAPEPMVWHKGEPPKPWRSEWFIAETTYGDRVVLRALPEEYTYDYKTADETFIKADKIKRWMQFPDSGFVPAASSDAAPEKDT